MLKVEIEEKPLKREKTITRANLINNDIGHKTKITIQKTKQKKNYKVQFLTIPILKDEIKKKAKK